MDIYSFSFKDPKDIKKASEILAQTCGKVETLFGPKRSKEVGMMRSDRSLRWIIEVGPGRGEYLVRLFSDSLKQALGETAFKVDVLKPETCA